jgi:hypothetical protein
MPMPEKENSGYRHNDVGKVIVKCVEGWCWICEIIITANKFNCRGKTTIMTDEFVSKERTVPTNGDYPIGRLNITSMEEDDFVKGDSLGIFPKGYPQMCGWLKMMEAKRTPKL